MNKILTFLITAFTLSLGYAQCLEPVAEQKQYFCTGASITLDDLEVDPVSGNLSWYDDETLNNSLPGTTPVVDGETYYVLNDCGATSSNAVQITVYEQSVEFVVSPSSCVNLGGNVFFIEDSDLTSPVEIEVLNLDGNPFDEKIIWSPVADSDGYEYYHPLNPGNGWTPLPSTNDQNNQQLPVAGFVFNHLRKNLASFELVDLELDLPVGNSGCDPSTESIIIIAGGLDYKGICYGSAQDLQDISDYYEAEGIFNQPVTWYDAPTGGAILPANTAVTIGDVFYADFDIAGCDVRIPVEISYKVEAPLGGGEYFFCSDAAWDLINVTITETLADVPVSGANLNWYDENNDPIVNPSTIVLEDGDVYYVTNEVNGCQSEPLEIHITQKDCGCIVDAGINSNSLDGFEFYTSPVAPNACNRGWTNATPINQGTLNGVAGSADRAVAVSPGFDPILQPLGHDLERTSPFGNSTYGLRLNNGLNNPGHIVVHARKDFVAGEVLTLDFATILEDPSHPLPDQPYFQVNIYDAQRNVIQTRCVVADPNDCIFIDAGSNILYSEWSTIKLDTREIQGEPAILELMSAWCEWTGHFGVTYVDNIFVGDDADANPDAIEAFGYIEVETLDNGSHIYNNCSYMDMNRGEICEAVLPALNPDFPIQVCGKLDEPVNRLCSAQPNAQLYNLNVYKNGGNVGTVQNANPTATGFCFNLDATDITVPLYGHFTLEAHVQYLMNEGPNEYFYDVKAQNSGFKICPVAECVEDMAVCVSSSGPLQHTFDLTTQEAIALSEYTDQSIFSVSYYEDLADANARNAQNAISNPNNFTATGTHTIYLRVDYDWQALGLTSEDDCYDLISFEVTVSTEPELPTDPIELELCEIEGKIDYVFDLETQDLRDDILAEVDPTLAPNHTLEFYNTQNGATNQDANDLISTPASVTLPVGATDQVWVRIIAPGDCFSIYPIDLEVYAAPTVISSSITTSRCEDAANPGVGIFDLLAEEPNMIDPTLGYTLAYFTDAGLTNLIPVTDLNTYNGNHNDKVYVEVTDPATECTTVVEIVLAVVEAPVVPPLVALGACDSGNGQASFPLDDVVPIVQAGDTNLGVDFYASQAAADAAIPGTELSSPYTSGNATVFVRANYPGADCPAVVPLDLVVNPLPAIPTIAPLEQCEDPSGASLVFPLATDPSLITAILDGRAAADFAITFHDSAADANNGTPTITTITTRTSTSVWVRIEDLTTLCPNTFELDIKVNPLPSINSPVELQECDTSGGNGIATFDLFEATVYMVGQGSNYNVTYYASQPQAEQGDVQDELPLNYDNTSNPETIYARIEDKDTGCHITEPIQLEVLEAPEAQDAQLFYCDVNNDGEGVFHLPDARNDITSDGSAGVSYHLTQADAENNANPLPDTVNNNMINNQQFIYVRVEVPGVGCYTVVRLELIVQPTPDLVHPTEPLIGCDIDGTGVYPFDLESFVNDVVLVNLTNPNDYDITYFETDANGDKAGQITAPSAYSSSSGTVIVVVTIPSTGCSSEVEIELFVAPLPDVFHPAHLEVCDINNPGDEIEWFYLDEAIPEITGGDSSLIVTFHETQQKADNGEDALDIPYQNTQNNQTIYIRVENEFGCRVTTGITLTLKVNPLPAPVTPDPLEVCDIDNEGYAYFDLDSLKNEIIANEPGVDVTFHETLTDAENGLSELSSPYQNIVASEQIVYARVFFEDPPNGTGCFTIIEVTLRAIPSPVVPVELDDLYFCTPDVNSSVRVNLTVYEDLIYGNQDRSELDLTYHLTQQAAEDGTGSIANPTDYLLQPPTPVTIYVRLGYTNGECYNIVPFTLHLVEGPQINDPTPLSVCTALGEPNSETAVFDLLDKREEIIGQATGLGIYFYVNEADALIGNNNYISDPTNYTNTTNPQDIYVRVVDSQENSSSDTGCVAHTTLTLRVEPNPEPGIPDPIEVCHLDTGQNFAIVDLTIRNLQILDHESWDLEFYERYIHAATGNLERIIVDPTQYELATDESPKTIYVRVINPTSGCFEIVELQVILSGLPDLLPPEDIEPMVECVTDGSERALFDLTAKIPEIFGNQNLDGFEVFFYEDQDEAIAGVNPIIDPDSFYNRESPQTIFVGVGNPDIDDCYIGGVTWFEIEVREGAIANSPTEPYKVCGVEGENGEVAIFDLYDEDLIESILGLQNPDFFDVDYFLTEEDAHEGAIENRLTRNYENVTNPQTIYARVTNQDSGCYAIAEVVLEVIIIPGLNINDLYSLCLDQYGNPIVDSDGNAIYPIIDTGLDALNNEFVWYFEDERILGQVGPTLEAKQVGTYRVEIENLDSGCTLSFDIKVIESAMPFNYDAEITSPAFSGTYDIEAWAEGLGDYTFSLNHGLPQDHGTFTNVGPGTHVITITDKNGCGSVDVEVSAVDYPKFFTPNDDGYNDTWNIPGIADIDPSAEIFIFDRHGKLLKQLNPLSEGWNGTFNGKPLPSTDYWFVVKYHEDGVLKEFKGHFSLKR